MGKRRHQSSSVEEASPAVVRRTSSRLTRAKKLKATSKSNSPVLGRSPLSRKQEAGPSRAKNFQGRPARRSDLHSRLGLDYTTPVRAKHGRHSVLQLNSPHSESEPEIIWDDKSPNAIQPRKLGRGGKRNAVENISDIINCVPEVTADNSNKKPSLLSLWMTRDSPSPKPETKTSQDSNRPSKKKGIGKKARHSRLSALTHELEKVLSAIEPEEEEEEEPATTEHLPCSTAAATITSSTTTSVKTKSTSPTLYTQTKPTPIAQFSKEILLPQLGQSPASNDENPPDPTSPPKLPEKQPLKKDSDKGSDDSPPGSQTKWEAVGNASANDLWGDDDLFEDDNLLMETIEVEIASSQVPQSTPIRKVRKRQSLKKAGAGIKKVDSLQSTKEVIDVNASAKPVTGFIGNEKQSKPVKLEDVKQPTSFVRTTSTGSMQSQSRTVVCEERVPSSCPVQVKSGSSDPGNNARISQSQKVFVPHRSNPKPGFEAHKPSATTTEKVDMQTSCAPHTQVKKTITSSTYSLRSGNKTPATMSKPQRPNTFSKAPASAPLSTSVTVPSSSTSSIANRPLTRQLVANTAGKTWHQSIEKNQGVNNASHDQRSKSSISSTSLGISSVGIVSQTVMSTTATRTDPPSVTRVVHSSPIACAAANPSSVILPISQNNKFVPFRSGTHIKQSSSCATSNSSMMHAKPADQPKTQSLNIGQVSANDSNKPFASKVYVPYQKWDALKKQNITPKVSPHATSQSGSSKGNLSQQTKVYVPYSKQSCQATTPTSGHSGQSQTTSKLASSASGTQSGRPHVPYKKPSNQMQPSATHTQSLTVNSAIRSSSASQSYPKSEKPGSQPLTSCSSNRPNGALANNATSLHVSGTIPSNAESVKQVQPQPQASNMPSQRSGSMHSKTFVPFKKSQSVCVNQCKPPVGSNCNQYKPAIPSSRNAHKFQPIVTSSNQYKSNSSFQTGLISSQTDPTPTCVSMTKSNEFMRHQGINSSTHVLQTRNTNSSMQTSVMTAASVPATKSHVFVKHTRSASTMANCKTSAAHMLQSTHGSAENQNQIHSANIDVNRVPNVAASASTALHSNASKILPNSNYLNNNNDMSKIFPQGTGQVPTNKNNQSISSRAHPSNTGAVGVQSKTLASNSVSTGPVLKPSAGQMGQFDDSLPDEMLMSLVDMDGSWDEF